MGILLIPIGGCGAIQHWTNLKIIKKLNKPYHILLDSDKTSIEHESPNLKKLKDLGYKDEECSVTKKREIECYIPSSYFKSLLYNNSSPHLKAAVVVIIKTSWSIIHTGCKRFLC